MMLKPYREILTEYYPHLSSNIEWEGPDGGTLLLLSTIYVCSKHNYPEDERRLAKEAIEILLEYGANPTKVSKTIGMKVGTSPLELADFSKNSKLYEYMVNSQFETKSVMEATAFENKFTNGLKKALKVINLPRTAANWTVDQLLKIKDPQVKKEVEKAMAAADKKVKEEDNLKAYKPEIKKQKKALEILEKDSKLKDLIRDDKQVAMALAHRLSNLGQKDEETGKVELDQEGKELLKAASKLAHRPGVEKSSGENQTSNGCIRFLLDPKFGKPLSEILSLHGTSGLGVGERGGNYTKFTQALKQLKVIAYFDDRGYEIKDLRSNGSWKSLAEMSKVAEEYEKPKNGGLAKSVDSATGREIISNLLKKKPNSLTNSDLIKYLSPLLKKSQKETETLYNSKKKQIYSLLNKNIKKIMKDDSLEELFSSELIEIFTKSDSGLTDEQESAIVILQSMGIPKKQSMPIVKELEGNLEEIIRAALKSIPSRGGI